MTFKPALASIFRYSTLSAFLAFTFSTVPATAQSAEEHARQMNDIAATPVFEDGPANDRPPIPPYDPVQNRIMQMQGMAMIQMQGERELAQLKQDPRYQIYLHGGWEYFDGRKDIAPGEYCTAMFWQEKGAITLSGPGDGFNGAMIMFAGTSVPTPKKMTMVSATLVQTGAAPATVKAFNFQKDPDTPGVGTIAFVVPSPEALMGGMLDKNDFQVSIKGKEVFRLGWHGGLAARKQWAECIAKRAR